MTDRHRPSAPPPRHRHLATFEHCYRVAIQRRRATGRQQFVIRTGDPRQPFRTTSRPPAHAESILALVA